MYRWLSLVLLLAQLLLSPPAAAAAAVELVPVHTHLGRTLSPAGPPPLAATAASHHHLAAGLTPRTLRSTRKLIRRPRSTHGDRRREPSQPQPQQQQAAFSALGREQREWELVEVDAPDMQDMATLVNLAKMANDAYALPGQARWMELDAFNLTLPFGWETDEHGLRGHVFASPDARTVVISFKGTSIDGPLPPKGGSTARLDQLNDNLLFSCCCGALPVGVCGCATGAPWKGLVPAQSSQARSGSFSTSSLDDTSDEGDGLADAAASEVEEGSSLRSGRRPLPGLKPKKKTCDETCVADGLYGPESYYPAALSVYAQTALLYPAAQIWLTGHSLGGVLGALVGLATGSPAVAYEAPADGLAVRRLGLGWGEGKEEGNPVVHVYHTGDMIATSSCDSPLSACRRGGYALESRCKQGQLVEYDTVGKWGWKVDRTGRSHTIQWCIDNVYSKPWNNGEKEGPEGRGRDWTDVPLPKREKAGCVDCAGWKFV